ncbi:hypothetical protein CBW65_23375 [Tumebacillus avium]|uniref:Bulb-type lectin domain-containing protein n=1 Tax=Tumebacillus avium TaxID=1903704 RepID=A0A1Y0IT50_9BACL|nr:hypothetical protein CBW65_23375 [Tumebacillus avium]
MGAGTALAAGEPTLLWHAAYDGGGYEAFGDVFETADGGLIGYGIDGDVVKMDGNAGIEWAVNLPVLARDLNVTADGGYILVGDNGFMAKLDAAGNVLWQKTFASGADLMSVNKTADGGFIVSGNLYVAGASDNVFLMKTDAGGNSIWEKNFGGAKTDIAGESGSVQQTTDGGYVVVGTTWTYSNELYNSNVYLIRTDANGNQKWYKTYGSTKTDMGYSVQQTSDGGFIIGGRYEYSTDGDAYLVKTDMLGNLTWQRTYGGTGSDYGYTAEQTADGGYILGGYYSFSTTDFDMYAVKTDAYGALQWQQSYGGALGELANSIHQTSDGGYILGGYTETFAQTNRDYYLVRLGYPTALTEGLDGALKSIPYEKTSKALAAPLAKR